MGNRPIAAAALAALLVSCSAISALPTPDPSSGGFVPTLGGTVPPQTSRPPASAAASATSAASASASASASPSTSPTASASPTPIPAADIVAKMLETVGAQTSWSDRTVLGGLVKALNADGSVSQSAASTAATTSIAAPNKRELTIVDNVSARATLHTILIGSDLFTEVAGIGWEQSPDPGIAIGPVFALDAVFGPAIVNALRLGNARREGDAPCGGASCYLLSVDFTDGKDPIATKARATISVDPKQNLPISLTTRYTYSDGLFYVSDRTLRDWGGSPKIAAPATVVAAPAPSITPSPSPSVAATSAPTPAPTPAPAVNPTPAPTPQPTINPPDAPIGYSRFTVGLSRGTFTVYLVKEPLASVTVKTLTATTTDCVSCPAQPLASYIGQTPGAFAGMNGSYFCPPDYADCASTPYKFDYAVYNSLLGKWLSLGNGSNGVATFNGKTPGFYATFNQYGRAPVSAGISNFPTLMVNGAILSFDSQLSAAQLRAGTRGVIATNATYVFLFLVAGASVTDAAYVAQALGATNALNLDGGGSSALYIDGAYKVGPGRLLPNAVVLTRP